MKMTKIEMQEAIGCDTLSVRKGVWVARWGFFFTKGATSIQKADRVRNAFPAAKVLEHGELWKAFRGGAPTSRQSHWWVAFTLPPQEEEFVEGELIASDVADAEFVKGFADDVLQVRCPRCNANPGDRCRSMGGVKQGVAHTARISRFNDWQSLEGRLVPANWPDPRD